MYYGWVVVGVSFFTTAVVYMLMYSFPVFSVVFIEDMGWARGPTAMIFSVMQLVYVVACPLAGALYDRFGARKVVCTGCLIITGGFWVNSYVDSLAAFYLTYGLVLAWGFGLSAMVPHSAIIIRWFAQRKDRGIASGIATSGLYMGILLVPFVQVLVFQFGWRGAFQWLGALAAIVLVPLVLVAQRPAPSTGAATTDSLAQSHDAARGWAASPRDRFGLRQYVRMAKFWWLILVYFSYGVFLNLVVINLLPLLIDRGWDKMAAATSMSLVSGVALVSTILWGLISDRLGSSRTYAISTIVAGLAVFLLVALQSSSAWPTYIALGFFGFGSGIAGVLVTLASDLFGKDNFGVVFGVLNMGYGFGNVVGPGLGGYTFDLMGNYNLAFYIATVGAGLSILFVWRAFSSHPTASHGAARTTTV